MLKRLVGKVRQFPAHDRGMAAIEMALIFPFMLTLYFGMIDVTNLISANRKITLASSTMADLLTQEPGATSKANINAFLKAIQPIIDPFPADIVAVQLFNYRKNLVNGKVERIWNANNGKSCGSAPAGTEVSSLDKLMTDGNDILIARVCITLQPITGKVLGNRGFKLQDQLALRPRQSAKLDCADCTKN